MSRNAFRSQIQLYIYIIEFTTLFGQYLRIIKEFFGFLQKSYRLRSRCFLACSVVHLRRRTWEAKGLRYTDFIWDYDGTLFDTYDAVCRSYMRAVRDKGIDISWEELRWMSKHSLGWAAQQLEERYHVPANELLALRAHYADEEETMETMRPYPGTAEVLAAICANGGRNYLYSHRDKRSIEALEFYGLRQYFTDFITKDNAFPRKPAPDALLYLVEKHGLNPATCVMVGDRVLDVEAGLNAGMNGALFDPENFCKGDAPTPWQFDSMVALKTALVDE